MNDDLPAKNAKGAENFIFSAPLAVKIFDGAKRDRTADLLNAIQALSQLSYGPPFINN